MTRIPLWLLAATGAFAQAQAQRQLEMAQDFPADRYDYRPAKDVRSLVSERHGSGGVASESEDKLSLELVLRTSHS